MILDNPATVKLLGALSESGPHGATREFLQQKTGLGKTTFYRVLKPLLGRGIIREEASRYCMPLDHPYNFLFKRLHSIEKVEEFRQVDRDKILSVVEHAKANLQGHLLALWLIGSAAHQTMTAESDLDFLAVTNEESEYAPDLAYAVHFVTMTEEEFRVRWSEKNDFVLIAIRHGLLLEDRGFAQEFYSQPLPIQLKSTEFHSEVVELEEQKERILLLIKARAPQEAEQALSHYAISVIRRMLRVYNVLPAGKPALLRASELLFGAKLRQMLELAIHGGKFEQDTWGTELLAKCHEIETVYQRFSSYLTYLQKFAELVTTSGTRHEELVFQALQELAEKDSVQRSRIETYGDVDGLLTWKQQVYLVEVKSLAGPLTEAPLRRLSRYLDMATSEVKAPRALLIANPYRDTPVLERGEPFNAEIRFRAHSHGVQLRSALELLCALNRSVIEPTSEDLLAEILQSAASMPMIGQLPWELTNHQNKTQENSMTKKPASKASKSSSRGEQTSKKVAKTASSAIKAKSSSKAVKTASGSALSQSGTDKETSAAAASKASGVLSSSSSSKKEKSVAGSTLTQKPSKKKKKA